jgi:predicted phosphodiesterase
LRFLILSDIHGNLQALDAVLADAAPRGYDQVLVLGDLVGYGANPADVLARICALRPQAMVRGNHDKVCCGLAEPEGFNDDAIVSAAWTAGALSDSERAQLKALPQGPIAINDDLEICHGAPFDEDYYIFDKPDGERALDAMTRQVCFFGHTHMPAAFAKHDGRVVVPRFSSTLSIQPHSRICINAGSAGQPRDGDWRAAYGIFDADRLSVEFIRVEYDVAAAQDRIRRAGLPHWLADRLELGY